MGEISKFLPWRENFAPEHDAIGLEIIPSGNFPYFCRPTPENFDSVFLTVVRVHGGFDHRATKIMFRRFDHCATTIQSHYYPISVLSTNGATNGGLN